MRSSSRRATLWALAAMFVACVAGAATAIAASALTIGLPAVEVTVPTTEVSLGGVHASTPGTTVTVPSVGITTPAPPASLPEAPVTVSTPPLGEQGGGAGRSQAASNPGEGGHQTPSSGASHASQPTAASTGRTAHAGASPARRTTARRTGARRQRDPSRAGAVAGTSPGTSTPSTASSAVVPADPPGSPRAPGRHSTANPLDSIAGGLPLPLPVPDWSKPIILLLLLLAIFLGVRALLSARRAKRLEAQQATLLSDLEALQAALVPAVPAGLAAEGVSVAYHPAEGVAAGGDFYDVFQPQPGRVGLVLGDVCGHGRDALERAALARYTIRAYLHAGLEPRAALALANEALADPSSLQFATVVAAVYDPGEGRLTYACAGHPAPIILGDGAVAPIEVSCSAPVGAGLPTGRRQSSLPLTGATAVCFFTDGLTEARCADGLLGADRLTELLAGLYPPPNASDLLTRVTDEAAATPDDMAACVLVPQENAAVGARVEELELDRGTLDGGEGSRFLDACGVAGAEATRVLGRAREVLAAHRTAVLRVELLAGATHVLVSAPAREGSPARGGTGEGAAPTVPAVTSAHA